MPKMTILTLGSRGDVQPYIAIGHYYQQRGYEVTICTGASFQPLVEAAKLNFYPTFDLMALLETPEGKAMMEAPFRHPLRTWNYTKTVVQPGYRQSFTDFWQASQGADVIIYHPKVVCAIDIAEKLAIPAFHTSPVPILYPITEFPNLALSPTKNLGSTLNRLSYVVNQQADRAFIKEINNFREHVLNLPKRKAGKYATHREDGTEIPIVYPLSPSLFADVSSWQGHVQLPGFFAVPTSGALTAEIETFLATGKAPIVITFSSMPLAEPEAFWQVITEYAEQAKERIIFLRGASGVGASSTADILVIDQAPHELLFSRAKAVIHHGGIGTVAAALRAGVPQLLFPQAVDQPFWAKRLQTLGLIPPTSKLVELTSQKLARLLQEASQPARLELLNQYQQQLLAEQPTDFVAQFSASQK